jgi:hypothetical protein
MEDIDIDNDMCIVTLAAASWKWTLVVDFVRIGERRVLIVCRGTPQHSYLLTDSVESFLIIFHLISMNQSNTSPTSSSSSSSSGSAAEVTCKKAFSVSNDCFHMDRSMRVCNWCTSSFSAKSSTSSLCYHMWQDHFKLSVELGMPPCASSAKWIVYNKAQPPLFSDIGVGATTV